MWTDSRMTHRHDLTLVLVRHGETEGESSIRYHGRNDVALSELGRAQMLAARQRDRTALRRHQFDHIFATPLSRACEGAKIIAGREANIVTVEEFIEVHFGLFEGLTKEEIQARHPIEFEKWRADPLSPSYTYPEGENRAGFTERVERGLATTLKLDRRIETRGERARADRRASRRDSHHRARADRRGAYRRSGVDSNPRARLPSGIRWCSTSPRISIGRDD